MKTLGLQFIIPVLFILCVNGMSSLPTQPFLFLGIPSLFHQTDYLPLLLSLDHSGLFSNKRLHLKWKTYEDGDNHHSLDHGPARLHIS